MNEEFSNFDPPENTSESFSKYLNNFSMRILNKYFGIKTRKFSAKHLASPWIDPDILFCINKKHRWFRLMKYGRITVASYKTYVRKLRRLLWLAESKYYRDRFEA